ncbi:MAG: hypothetical protein IKB80_02465 [Oscillospiraceae bacterium]|nr:hypothetical protein [Oscillospiraceae bacterium]
MRNKVFIAAIAVALSIIAVLILVHTKGPDTTENQNPSASTPEQSASQSASTVVTEETQAEDPTIYPDETVEFQMPDISTSYLQTDIYTTIDNNIFMDALLYTGYNITKHRADGMMWDYVPSADKRGLGYLSNISYGGGCSGYETDENDKPNIARFEQGNLVCASFVTYVYFNYLPNVAGIDTSALTRPTSSVNANSFYTAAKDWVEKGYSEYIPFEYEVLGALGSSFIKFTPSREIPIGSLIIFCNPKTSMTAGSHVTIYAGSANGYDWLYHVGNQNGPEFCAVQRMNFGPNARWPIAVITPPSNIRFTPVLEIELVDKAGKPICGSEFILKHPTSGKEISLGTTDDAGKLVRTDLSYGDFKLVQIVPNGYSCKSATNSIKISGVNNSYNKVRIVNTKVKS